MAKVMMLGDLHGNLEEGLLAIQNAEDLDIEVIVQCGDMGIWPGRDGMLYLDGLNAALIDAGVMLIFVPGNHEDYNQLERAEKYNPRNQFGQVFLRSNILFAPRGSTWEIEGKRFMGVGGAVSVDKAWRQPNTSWWPQEELTDEQLAEIIENHQPGSVDYLVTHDSPSCAPFKGRRKDDLESVAHRQRMDKLGLAVAPKLWHHGHFHTKYDGYQFPAYEPTTTVYGLEMDGDTWNWGVLDTETDTFEWGRNLITDEYAPAEWDGEYALLPD